MYKININDNILYLTDTDKINNQKFSSNALVSPYNGKSKQLLSFIDMLEKTNRFNEVVIYSKDLKMLKLTFESLFKVVKASGGVVTNPLEEILMIFRRGFWDLPKGKIDKGEKKKEAAIREVEEETGINNIEIGSKICTTRHTYRLKDGRRAIKKTYWYFMNAPQQKLIPQSEEDIELAIWTNPDTLIKPDTKIYKSIIDVLKKRKKRLRNAIIA